MPNCVRCNQKLPFRDFFRKNDTQYHSYCKKCLVNYQNERWRRRKTEAIAYKGGKCIACGYARCIAALEFHHRDRNTKELSGNQLKSMSWEKIKAEIDKCDLLCANCHREQEYG
jgi:hypothetical protein